MFISEIFRRKGESKDVPSQAIDLVLRSQVVVKLERVLRKLGERERGRFSEENARFLDGNVRNDRRRCLVIFLRLRGLLGRRWLRSRGTLVNGSSLGLDCVGVLFRRLVRFRFVVNFVSRGATAARRNLCVLFQVLLLRKLPIMRLLGDMFVRLLLPRMRLSLLPVDAVTVPRVFARVL